jgi:hypothetical protein
MSIQTWQETLTAGLVDGPTLTAAAAASCIPTASRLTLPNGYFSRIGQQLLIRASGRISCVVTTPGTARFDVRMGTTGTIVVFDGLAVPLNVNAKTSVGWWLEILLTLRAVGSGTSANFMGQGHFQSEAVIGSPAASSGGNGIMMLPFNTAPAVGTGFDSTAANVIDMFFTQTVATGSLTVHQYHVSSLN